MIFGRRHSGLKRLIDDYGKKLASHEITDVGERIRLHHAKLVIESNPEIRLRSFQTLVEAQDMAALVPLMKEIVLRSNRWPSQANSELSWMLLDGVAELYRIRHP